MKKHLPPKEIGNRACEEFNAYALKNGLTVKAASKKIGIERKSSIAWSKGGAPCALALSKMAAVGIDVQYIITGKRAMPLIHTHWDMVEDPTDPDDEPYYYCAKCHCGNGIPTYYCPRCGAKMDEEAE